MSTSALPVPLGVLWRRTVVAVVQPRRVLTTISLQARFPGVAGIAVVMLPIWLVDVLWHPALLFGQPLYRAFPTDWGVFALGWAVFGLNQWVLCVLGLQFLARTCRPQGLAGIGDGALWVAAHYIVISGIWLVGLAVDLLHPLTGLPPWRLDYGGWLEGPLMPTYAHLAWGVQFPWVVGALWLVGCHVLRCPASHRGRLLAFAILLPVAGRLLIEPLPNLAASLIQAGWGRPAPMGLTVLGTELVLAGVLQLVLRWRIGHRV